MIPNPDEPETTQTTDETAGFDSLPLRPEVLAAVKGAGYETPTDVQRDIIPHVHEGRDVLAQSQTGSGKTAAFALPILSRIDLDARTPQVLVLAPTRELAIQVARSFATYGKNLPGFSVAAIYGGQDYDAQFKQLRRGVHVVVGTPGRVIDHVKRKTLRLDEIKTLVLDEADEMLNMGFLEDVEFVLEQTPKDRQIALFSATLPRPIRNIAERYQNDPVTLTVDRQTVAAASIRQRALLVGMREKFPALLRLLETEETDGVIVFTRTKDSTVTVADQLQREGLSAVALNGDMPQKVRERTIDQLATGRLNILVATDVAARGLDVSRVSHVFNYDAPHDTQSYVHRIGRTGRAGRKGEAIIFVTNGQRRKLRDIERVTKQSIEIVRIPGADEINAARTARFKQRVLGALGKDGGVFEKLVEELAEESDATPTAIAAALAHLAQDGRPFLMTERRRPTRSDREPRDTRGDFERRDTRGRPERPEREGRRDRFGLRDREDGPRHDGPRHDGPRHDGPRHDGPRREGAPRRFGPPEEGMDRYRIEVGRQDGVQPGNIVGAVANEAGLDGADIGAIRIYDEHSTVDLPEGMPKAIFKTLQRARVSGKPLRLSRSFGEGERPFRGAKSKGGKRGPDRSGPSKRRS